MSVWTPCSSLLAAARSVLEVEAESMDGVPGRLPVLELPAEPRPPPRLGGVRFFWRTGSKRLLMRTRRKTLRCKTLENRAIDTIPKIKNAELCRCICCTVVDHSHFTRVVIGPYYWPNSPQNTHTHTHTHTHKNNHHKQCRGRLSLNVAVVGAVWLSAAVCDTQIHTTQVKQEGDSSNVAYVC